MQEGSSSAARVLHTAGQLDMGGKGRDGGEEGRSGEGEIEGGVRKKIGGGSEGRRSSGGSGGRVRGEVRKKKA